MQLADANFFGVTFSWTGAGAGLNLSRAAIDVELNAGDVRGF